MASRARRGGIELNVKQIFKTPTIAGLAASIKMIEPQQATSRRNEVTGFVSLTPIQHWFFNLNLAEQNYFNQALLLETKKQLEDQILEKAIVSLLKHHEEFNLRFRKEDEEWQQWMADVDSQEGALLQRVNLEGKSELEQRRIIKEITTELQSSLDIEKGPVLRAALFDYGREQGQRLFITIHHLVVDGVSWRILLEDLEKTYRQIKKGEAVQLPEKTSSYQAWAEALKEYTASEKTQEELGYWKKLESVQYEILPIDFDRGENTVEASETITASLNEQETKQLLQEAPQAYHTQINDLLLTALAQSMGEWTGSSSLCLSLEGHGREIIKEGIDTSRTIGWFTSIFPVYLKLEDSKNLEDSIKTIKEQLRSIPRKGVGFGILRYLGEDTFLNNLPTPQLAFNYLGQWDNISSQEGLFRFTNEAIGPSVSPKNQRSNLLDINSQVINGRLEISWTYSKNKHEEKTIQNLANNFVQKLKDIITHCCDEKTFGYTPSDFPLIQVEQSTLDKILNKVGESKK
jgi:non-ribosomal peptide synthase protein (TIGR01720 family)